MCSICPVNLAHLHSIPLLIARQCWKLWRSLYVFFPFCITFPFLSFKHYARHFYKHPRWVCVCVCVCVCVSLWRILPSHALQVHYFRIYEDLLFPTNFWKQKHVGSPIWPACSIAYSSVLYFTNKSMYSILIGYRSYFIFIVEAEGQRVFKLSDSYLRETLKQWHVGNAVVAMTSQCRPVTSIAAVQCLLAHRTSLPSCLSSRKTPFIVSSNQESMKLV
jgi:hypothetical protein